MPSGYRLYSFCHYTTFGSPMPSRSFSASSYRYGFNGKEKDDEGMGGSSSTYDYGFRIYNPNLGRFLSVDPLSNTYPFYTPYQFASNNPIIAIDVDGLESTNDKNPTATDVNANFTALQTAYAGAFADIKTKSLNEDKTKSQEWGAVLLKVSNTTSTGAIETTYIVHNLAPGASGQIDGFNYGDLPVNTPNTNYEVVGNVHSHPYTEKEIGKQTKMKPGFDGNGDIFSSNDFLVYKKEMKAGNIKNGNILFVVAGNTTYGIEVLDVEKAKKVISGALFLSDIDYAENGVKGSDPGTYSQKIFAQYQKILETYGGEEKTGIRIHMKEKTNETKTESKPEGK